MRLGYVVHTYQGYTCQLGNHFNKGRSLSLMKICILLCAGLLATQPALSLKSAGYVVPRMADP